MRLLTPLLFLSLLTSSDFSHAAKKEAPVPDGPFTPYLKRDIFQTIRISPTGEFLAVTVPEEGRTSLAILRRSDLKPTGHVYFRKDTHVVDFRWVSPTRLLFSIGETFGELESPQSTGELYGVNADGTGQSVALIGSRSEGVGQRNVYASLLDTLRDDDDWVLLEVGDSTGFAHVDRMNVHTGKHGVVTKAPVKAADFLTDARSVVRFVTGSNEDNTKKTYYRANDEGDWELINDEAVSGYAMSAEGFSADGKTAYLQIQDKTAGPDGVYAFDTTTRKRELVYRDDNSDPEFYLRSPLDGSVYGVMFMDGLPRAEYLDPDSPFAKQHRNLQTGMVGLGVIPLSFSADGTLGLYLAYSDRVPGDFYLFDQKKNQASYVASRNDWFKPEMLAETKPINLKARDGVELEGYLTLPKGSNGKNLPLVLNPHGGPFGPFDQWGYNPEVQILAKHGYAVLQVNFRGSGNHGRAFLKSGHQQWGGKMQDDLTDATQWAIKQGVADPRRICIYGASYGGYASLMGVVKEPDLYRCAVGNVGVYDMAMMYSRGDIHEQKSGMNFLKEALGKTDLASISPNRQAARIKVPVMLAAGREDVRAPPQHTEMMRDALVALGKPVEMVIYEGEGHGNYLLKNQVDFYTRLLAFLDKHIGAGAAH